MSNETRIDYYLEIAQKYPHVFDNSSNCLEIVLDREVLIREQENLYQNAKKKGHPLHWYDIGVVSEDSWTIVLRDLVQTISGTYTGYIRMLNRKSQLERNGKDVVILVQVEGTYLILKHFRHDDRLYHWECPRGFGESNLTAEENARKEIMEETGLTVSSLEQLNTSHEPIAYFLAKCCGDYNCNDVGEGIETMRYISEREFASMIADGSINDQFSIKAYTLAKIRNMI